MYTCMHRHTHTCIFPSSTLPTCKFDVHVHLLSFYVLPLPHSPWLRKTQSTLGFNSLLSILLARISSLALGILPNNFPFMASCDSTQGSQKAKHHLTVTIIKQNTVLKYGVKYLTHHNLACFTNHDAASRLVAFLKF